MKIGSAIKELRVNKKINPTNFAKAIGVSRNDLASFESNEVRPSAQMLTKICKVFKITKPVLLFMALDESDVSKGKVEIFKTLKNPISDMIKSLTK